MKKYLIFSIVDEEEKGKILGIISYNLHQAWKKKSIKKQIASHIIPISRNGGDYIAGLIEGITIVEEDKT